MDNEMTQEEWEASFVWRDLLLTCHTPGCIGENETLELHTPAVEGNIFCGGCGTPIHDIVAQSS